MATVLDIRLPGIDGWEVLEELRADPETQELPVIIASILDERSRGLAAGAADYLVKPVAGRTARCAAPNARAAHPEDRAVGVWLRADPWSRTTHSAAAALAVGAFAELFKNLFQGVQRVGLGDCLASRRALSW